MLLLIILNRWRVIFRTKYLAIPPISFNFATRIKVIDFALDTNIGCKVSNITCNNQIFEEEFFSFTL